MAALLGLILVADHVFVSRCAKPTKLDVIDAQLLCASNLDTGLLTKKACLKIYEREVCDFSENDIPVIYDIAVEMINKCTDKELQSNKMCTKYPDEWRFK